MKKICCHFFFWSYKFHKIHNFQRIIELFTQKIVTKLSKIGGEPRRGGEAGGGGGGRLETHVFYNFEAPPR